MRRRRKLVRHCQWSQERVMNSSRRRFLQLAGGAAAAPALPNLSFALDYPTRPVRLLVGYATGGPTDITARIIAQWLSERLGQPFIIENRFGAGTNIATEAVVRASPDGYTLLQVTIANAVNSTLYDNLSFDFVRDIVPVATINRAPGVMEVSPSFPARTVPEFIAYAKANRGKITMATGGPGSGPHIYGELFKAMAGVDLVPVPYRSSASAITDLLGGQVQVLFDGLGGSIEQIRAGKLRALAVTTATRSEALPDVPAVGEFLAGYEASSWQGVGSPKNTPIEIVERLNKEINAGLADARVKAQLANLGSTVLVSSPVEFARLIAEETDKWRKVIRAANIKAE
jgi:tripartite-type tricarboxylate transporter receptor subunit TctC